MPAPLKGRGTRTNAAGRYERFATEAYDDGWGSSAEPDAAPPKLETIVQMEAARTIISRNTSPDISFDQSINAYRGCEHGCVYCYARPNHAYVGLSPGLDFETKLFVKADAAALLERELAKPGYACSTIVLGGVTDVYQPIERTYRATRGVLDVLWRWRHPLGLVTKSQLVLRDLDLLAPMAAANLARVAISLTTLDGKLARIMEPRAAAPHRRLEAIRALAGAGVPVTVMTAPLIPMINDAELETLLAAAAEAGARQAGYVLLRLPRELSDLFRDWLSAHFPDRAERVMKIVRETRGGRDYDATFGQRQSGQGPYARLIADRFRRACARLGLNGERTPLDVTQFRRPPQAGDQLDLLRDAADSV
jgi:DNA repair photolyase